MNKGQKILKEAKKIIPGGNQLLSKRSEIFLPGLWPTYYKKAKGCKIWDLDSKMYYDFAGMGVTSCVLGYADNFVNKAIINGLKKGSMATLNSTEEIELAKKILNIHKWAGMAKFCKSGGEACLVAIRIARAFSKKQNIAFCGYHGWHDWYLAANLENSKNLNSQLLPGLSTNGVSKTYSNTIKPFNYNNLESFKKVVLNKKNNIGIVIMEPMRAVKPKKDFLKIIRKITKKNKIILIFDEITSGFKDNYGGVHLKFRVNPDIAIYGKSIGNGYPISAIIGKKNIMQASQDTFISSTMWTESLGFIAANATLDKLKKLKVNQKIVNFGKEIKKGWLKLAKKNNLKIDISGLDSIPSFKFCYENNLEISTFFTQEMLSYGFLANTTLTTTLSFNHKIINHYLYHVDKVFKKISFYLYKNKIPLKNQIKHSTFKRLTG
jgi:glutamate-1-semialdehyde 2,1-aminomutase